jgi:hypothetical protein
VLEAGKHWRRGKWKARQNLRTRSVVIHGSTVPPSQITLWANLLQRLDIVLEFQIIRIRDAAQDFGGYSESVVRCGIFEGFGCRDTETEMFIEQKPPCRGIQGILYIKIMHVNDSLGQYN